MKANTITTPRRVGRRSATNTTDRSKEQRAQARKDRNVKRRQLAESRAAALLAGDGFLRLPEVLVLFPVGATTWWEGVRSGRYPQSVKLGARCTCWRASDIRDLIARTAEGAA